jgi:hypothetical protein
MGENEGSKSADKLVDSLRDFVKELNGQQAEKKETRPEPWDWVRLVLLIAAAVSLYTLIPEDTGKGPLEFLDKFVPWLLGGLWAVVNAWSRHTLIEYNRKLWVTILEVVLILALMPHWMRIFPLTPQVDPPYTSIVLDDKTEANNKLKRVTVRDHKITLTARDDDHPKDLPPPIPRVIEIPWMSLLHSPFAKGEISLRQIFVVYLKAPSASRIRLTLKNPGDKFDDGFLDPYSLQMYGDGLLSRLEEGDKDYDRAVNLDYKDPAKTDTIWLPKGDYNVVIPGCPEEGLTVAPSGSPKTNSLCQPEKHH